MSRNQALQKWADERFYELGREDGLFEGLQTAALALLRAKLEIVTAEQEMAIGNLYDVRRLNELIAALGRASSADDARAALAVASAKRDHPS